MILVARHGSRLQSTLAALEAAGFTATGCPLMATTPCPPQKLDKTVKGVILTSPSALPALPPTAAPVHCVGLRTAHAVQNAGFTVGLTGRGGARELAEELVNVYTPCPLVHLAGDTAKNDWYNILEEKGFSVKRQPAYTTAYVQVLPRDVVWQLGQNGVSSVMVFSAASARHLARLMRTENLNPEGLTAVCLSTAVAAAWPGPSRIAAHPAVEEMINVL
ncbi:MAG: hypothetical protein GC134_07520 [Proteobacteria bacterium]|nr:hypothetical protein [Pseudomonadota bacterium]